MVRIHPRQTLLPAIGSLVVAVSLWRGTSVSLLGFSGAVLVIALGIWLVGGLLSALRKVHDARLFQPGTWWRVLAGGHGLRLILILFPAFLSAISITVALVAGPVRTTLGAALIAVILVVIGPHIERRLAKVIVPGQTLRFVLPPAVGLAAGVTVVLSTLLRAVPAGDFATAVSEAARYTGSSALLGQVFDLHALASGLEETVRGRGLAGLAFGLVFDASVWFGLATALSLLLVPPRDLGRILAPEGPVKPPVLVIAGFVLAIVSIILVQTAAALESRTRVLVALNSGDLGPAPTAPPGPGAPAPVATDEPPERGLPLPLPSAIRVQVEEAERIGTLLCPPGTIARLDSYETRLHEIFAEPRARLIASIETGFDAMRANVPGFLDWYYSLGAEYLRTASLMIGSGDDYLKSQIESHLAAGNPFLQANAELSALVAARDLTAELDAPRREILADCGSDIPQDGVIVIVTAERLDERLDLPLLADRISFQTRLSTSSFAGLAAGVGVAVLAKLGAKLVVSSVFKAAAAALAKIAGSKALSFLGGVGAGALGGGTVGSVLPGAGTIAGSVIGGIVGGAAVMVGVDFAMIKLEEEISRDAFEAEILAAIDATETELMQELGLAY